MMTQSTTSLSFISLLFFLALLPHLSFTQTAAEVNWDWASGNWDLVGGELDMTLNYIAACWFLILSQSYL